MLLRKEKAMGKKITKIEPVKQNRPQNMPLSNGYAAYCRVSTGSAEQKNSFEAQVQYYTRFIEESRIGYWLESMRMKHEAVQK